MIYRTAVAPAPVGVLLTVEIEPAEMCRSRLFNHPLRAKFIGETNHLAIRSRMSGRENLRMATMAPETRAAFCAENPTSADGTQRQRCGAWCVGTGGS